MRTLAALIGTIVPTTAFAAVNVPSGNYGIFIWIFLGFFALIVAWQLIPALMLIMGQAKELAAKAEVR